MKVYFLRRLLLVPLTILGVTFLVFGLTRVMPGSPVERDMHAAAAAGGEGSGSGSGDGAAMDEETIEEIEREFLYDKSISVAYLTWLGVLPRERLYRDGEFKSVSGDGGVSEEKVGEAFVQDPDRQVLVSLAGSGRPVVVQRDGDEVDWARYVEAGKPQSEWDGIEDDGWRVRIETAQERFDRFVERNNGDSKNKTVKNYLPRAVIVKKRFSGLLQGDLGKSEVFGDPVASVIASRMPVALYFGILTAILTYGICLPLGILKAIKHRTAIDNLTSILIILGYSIPGFALGGVLIVYLGVEWPIFPMVGLTSPGFDDFSLGDKIKDLAWHSVLPLACYVVGAFAWMTLMMKNNLMDNLAADYVRTAVSKGVSFNRAIFRHAFRNSFIPIASTLGQLVTILVAGSILIEKVFDIQGFGLLQISALVQKDAFLIVGVVTVASFLLVIGNILSDVVVALIDPRVKFQ